MPNHYLINVSQIYKTSEDLTTNIRPTRQRTQEQGLLHKVDFRGLGLGPDAYHMGGIMR
jgi:hypothetical protein